MADYDKSGYGVGMDWQPIDSFPPDDFPYFLSDDGETKYYGDALVYGRTWLASPGVIYDHYPGGRGGWDGELRYAIASTYSGKGFWTVSQDAPMDYDVYIKPIAWARLSPPKAE